MLATFYPHDTLEGIRCLRIDKSASIAGTRMSAEDPGRNTRAFGLSVNTEEVPDVDVEAAPFAFVFRTTVIIKFIFVSSTTMSFS